MFLQTKLRKLISVPRPSVLSSTLKLRQIILVLLCRIFFCPSCCTCGIHLGCEKIGKRFFSLESFDWCGLHYLSDYRRYLTPFLTTSQPNWFGWVAFCIIILTYHSAWDIKFSMWWTKHNRSPFIKCSRTLFFYCSF